MLSMRKGLALVLAATMAVLAGCGGKKEETPSTGGDTPAPVQTVKIQVFHAMDPATAQGKTFEALVADFNKSQKEVEVEPVYQTGSYTGVDKAVSNAIQAGSGIPAVIQTADSNLTAYIDQKAVVPVDEYITSEKANLVASVLPPLTFDGKLMAVPFNKSMIVTIYDTTLVKDAPKTWDEFAAKAKELTVKDGRFGTVVEPTHHFFGQFMINAGGDWLDASGKAAFNSQAGVDALNFLRGMVKDGSATILKQGEFSSNLFNEKRVAMILTTSASFAHIKRDAKEWAAAPFIAGPKGDKVPFSGANLAILAQAKPEEQKAAGKFLAYMIGQEAQVKWATGETGYMPVNKLALGTQAWKDFVAAKPNYKVFEASLEKGAVQPGLTTWSAVGKEISAQMDKVLLGQVEPKAALDAAAEKGNALMKK